MLIGPSGDARQADPGPRREALPADQQRHRQTTAQRHFALPGRLISALLAGSGSRAVTVSGLNHRWNSMGPGLARMRPCGDWMELNGPRLTSTPHDQLGGRPDFSGAWMGMDGSTVHEPA